jgi:hypothetical protein
MDQGVQKFFHKIDALQRKGLPGMKVIDDKLMTLPDYKKRLAEVSKDNSKFAGIQGIPQKFSCIESSKQF